MKSLLFFLLVSVNIVAACQQTEVRPVYSRHVQDSFDIYITRFGNQPQHLPLHVIYYLDAGIKSGKQLRHLLTGVDSFRRNYVFVGVAHRGNFHQKRRRDYLPPIVGSDPAGRGKERADLFYRFLSEELVPALEPQLHARVIERSLIGHSFGGLFVFYALFRSDSLFTHYYALSPSLWFNRYDILRQEESFHTDTQALPVTLYLSDGTRERFNRILTGNRRMKALLERRAYKGLQLTYRESRGKNHFTQVPVSLKWILKHLPTIYENSNLNKIMSDY